MAALAEIGSAAGRWIVAPRKGAHFIGARNRARARACVRRRRVFTVLGEATGLTFLMGLFPPFRPMWFAAGVFGGLLAVYVLALLAIRKNEHEMQRGRAALVAAIESPPGSMADRANGRGNGDGHGVYERHLGTPVARDGIT